MRNLAKVRGHSGHVMTTTNTDDLTATVHSALTALDPVRKAEFLLDTALALINAGKYVSSAISSHTQSHSLAHNPRRYGDDVERYLDVYLKTPNLPKPSIAKALLARANARKACGDRLLTQAHQGHTTTYLHNKAHSIHFNRFPSCITP